MDSPKCMVGHPDTIRSNGLMKYTYETRGNLKMLLPTCKQPSPEEIKRAQAFQKKIDDQQAALQRNSEQQMKAPPNRTPDCQTILDAIKAQKAAITFSDGTGKGTFPGLPPGSYYLMISTRYNNQGLRWGFKVDLKSGPNSVTLDQSNGVPAN